MANDLDQIGDVLDHTLDEYLLGLAQGIQQAQMALNQISVPAGDAGQAAVAYHLPKLEFELRLHMSMQGSSGDTGAGAARQLRWRPASGSSSESYTADAVSVISGSFVSVPVASGRPPPLLRTSMQVLDVGQVQISVIVTDVLGTLLPNVDVNFNVDRERSAAMNGKIPLKATTNVQNGVVRSDAEGKAGTLLSIAHDEPASALIVLTVDIAGASETLLIPVQTGNAHVSDR